jgi:hypothetical protein
MADQKTKFLTMQSIEEGSTDAILELPLPPEPSMALLTQARNDLLLHIDSLTWDGAGDEGLKKELNRAVKKLVEISVAKHIKVGQLMQAEADAFDKYESIIVDIYGKAYNSGAPETAPPFSYLYTPDNIALDAQKLFHHLLTIAGLKPPIGDEVGIALTTAAADCVVKINRDGRAPTDNERREALQEIRQIVDRAAELVDTPAKPRDPAPKSRKPRRPRA